MNRDALRAEIMRNGMTQGEFVRALNMSNSTFWRHMKRGDFGLDDVNKMIELLNITNPADIFFCQQNDLRS